MDDNVPVGASFHSPLELGTWVAVALDCTAAFFESRSQSPGASAADRLVAMDLCAAEALSTQMFRTNRHAYG